MQTPVVLITVSFIAGIVLGRGVLFFPFSISLLTFFLLICLTFLARTRGLSARHLLLIAVPTVAGLVSYVYSAAFFPSHHYTRVFSFDKVPHEITGNIVSPIDRDPDRIAFTISAHSIDARAVSGSMRVSVRDAATDAGVGDTVRITGRVYQPRGFKNPGGFDYPAYLAQSGVYATVSVKDAGSVEIIRPGRGPFRTIQDWREKIRRAFMEKTTGPGSAILQAMVLGEEGGLTDEMRDRFMTAGVTHIISISGSHLGMLAVFCFALIRGLMFLLPEPLYHRLTLHADPGKLAAWLTLPLVVFYTLLAGGQVATVRSLAMISAALAAIIFDRENALMHSLAVAALLILLVNPQAAFDISFQLSFISVANIGFVVTLWSGLHIHGGSRLQKLRNNAVLLVLISLCTSLATGPLVAYYFNQFSFAGVISNMVVVPFAGIVVVPLGLLSGVLSLFFHFLPFSSVNQFAGDRFYDTVTLFSRLPFAEFHPRSPATAWLALYAVFVISTAGIVRSLLLNRFRPLEFSAGISRARVVTASLSGAALLVLLLLPLAAPNRSRITYVDVGQGDCALIELAAGRNILIDGGGTRDDRFDMGRRVLAPFLWNRGVRALDLVVLSHPHPDHMNGLKFILKKFRTAGVWVSGLEGGQPGYGNFQRIIAERGIPCTVASAETGTFVTGEAMLSVLHPAPDFVPRVKRAYAAENSRSLVVRLEMNGNVFLFPGDIEADAEAALARSGRDLTCDLLKVPHHGSKSSSTEDFVGAVRPKAAVVSVGKDNSYHHPSQEVIERYEQRGARVYRTDRDGAVIVSVDNDGLHIVPWEACILERISFDKPGLWGKTERENWRRLGIRTWET